MSTWDRQSNYYSGQGVVLIGGRDVAGKPVALKPVGNVTDLKISIETTTLEHKESQSGQRAIDFRLVTETKATLSMTLENFSRDVLATALRGDYSALAASSIVGEAAAWYPGAVAPLSKVSVSAVSVKRGVTALTAWTSDAAPYDYKLNADAGSVQFNDGSVTAIDKITTGGTAPTVIAVGSTTSVTVANAAKAGDYAAFTGFTGADAALVNGKAHRIVSATPTAVVIDLDTTGKTITLGAPLSAFSGQALTADFSYAAQGLVQALTQASQDRYLRFEGLNTLDSNAPMVIEAFRFVADPTQELALISGEEAAQFVIEGSLLADTAQTAGSKFFKQMLLR